MIEIIPAIDLIQGECVRLFRGDYTQKVTYSLHPVQVAQKWEQQGARRLHLVDLEGAKAGAPMNLHVVERIVKDTGLDVELGGGLRDENNIRAAFDAGVHYVVLGTAAINNPALLKGVSEQYPGRILVGVDAREGKVAIKGWLEDSKTEATELVKDVNKLDIGGVIYTDIQRDGALEGPNLESLLRVADVAEVPVTASGGISTLEDIRKIRKMKHPRVNSAIIGKALYEGQINLPEAIEAGKLEENE